jgi:dTDP-4-dehydrorhamnose 3,5-epimerase-like enzyme/dTDP-4-dehydrorhamnose reductase
MNILTPNIYTDDRGIVTSLSFGERHIDAKQQLLSINKKGVFRGIHISPYEKIITCLQGSFIDFIIDINTWKVQRIKLLSHNSIIIPANTGHAFISLEENSVLLYLLAGEFDPDKEQTIHYRDPRVDLGMDFDIEYIMSEKDKKITWDKIDYVVLGGSGFVGRHICDMLKKQDKRYMRVDTRLEDIKRLETQLAYYQPKYVISCAGIAGRPTIKWCDENKDETKHVNVDMQLSLADMCQRLDIHLTIFGSTLVYDYTEDCIRHSEVSQTSVNGDLYYSKMRIFLEDSINKKGYNNLLYLRIGFAISGDLDPKCFLTKMKQRARDNSVHNANLSITVLPSMLPILTSLIESKRVGIYNFVNKNPILLTDLTTTKNIGATATKHLVMDTSKLESIVKIETIQEGIRKLPNTNKILLLILTSDHPHYVNLDNQWRQYMHSHPMVTCKFLRCNPDMLCHEAGDAFYAQTKESLYAGIYWKVIKALKFYEGQYDLIFRTNGSSFIRLDKFYELACSLPKNNLYSGAIGDLNGIPFVSGAGCFFSSDVCRKIVENSVHYTGNFDPTSELYYLNDDVEVSKSVNYACPPTHPNKYGHLNDDVQVGKTIYNIFPLTSQNRYDIVDYARFPTRDEIGDNYHIRIKLHNRLEEYGVFKHIHSLFYQ